MKKPLSPNQKESNYLDKSSLNGIRKVIDLELYRPNTFKAIFTTAMGVGFHFLSLFFTYLIWKEELFYLYPFAWFLTGTSATTMFVLGHDCAHGSFLKSKFWNDALGHFFFAFPIYPYFAWKFSHNAHHKDTNLLESSSKDIYFDNAWIPLTVKQYNELKISSPFIAKFYKLARFFPPIGSFSHNIITHFFPSLFVADQRKKVYFSYSILALTSFSIIGSIGYFFESWTLIVHLFLMPAIFFQFWMSLYTYQHHTSTEMKFYQRGEWTPYKGQIESTYNPRLPWLISFLHLRIDIHTPHHLSTSIPCYHLKEAQAQLKDSPYSTDISEGKFSFRYYLHQIKNCHLWDEDSKSYKSFKSVEKK